MNRILNELTNIKNQWFNQHVDVDFPTKESLLGRDLFLSDANARSSYQLKALPQTKSEYAEDEIFKVDFHRLTVMFSLLQSQRWNSSTDQALVVEFLSQIIFSPPCDLYVGFLHGEPAAAAVVTKHGSSLLVSDIVTAYSNHEPFLSTLLNHSSLDIERYADIYIESL
ncbi:flavodoxin [Vibrio hepatarius]|uniref:flavodoxin n=1 Tax=Vibrio hepatarius TaxID=171383 RepID=UPI001C0A3FDC|nr:flavodoxin [Vibrio hepatarius]MBU2895157.1 flavodoxin [Vibrio hepatarius]